MHNLFKPCYSTLRTRCKMLYCSHRPKRCRTTLIFRVPTPLSRLPYGSSKLQGVRFAQVRGSEVLDTPRIGERCHFSLHPTLQCTTIFLSQISPLYPLRTQCS